GGDEARIVEEDDRVGKLLFDEHAELFGQRGVVVCGVASGGDERATFGNGTYIHGASFFVIGVVELARVLRVEEGAAAAPADVAVLDEHALGLRPSLRQV